MVPPSPSPPCPLHHLWLSVGLTSYLYIPPLSPSHTNNRPLQKVTSQAPNLPQGLSPGPAWSSWRHSPWPGPTWWHCRTGHSQQLSGSCLAAKHPSQKAHQLNSGTRKKTKQYFLFCFFFPVQSLARCIIKVRSPNPTGHLPKGAFLHASIISWLYYHGSLPPPAPPYHRFPASGSFFLIRVLLQFY